MFAHSPISAAAVVLLAATGVGCSKREQARTPATATVPTVTISATDYAFSMPDTIGAGVVRLRLVNHGPSLHHVQLVRLAAGKTLDSLMAAMRNPGPPPAWARFVAGPNAPAPGDSSELVENLAPGQYAVICLIPNDRGVLHVAMGMARPLVVSATGQPSAPEPTADVQVDLRDYEFTLSTEIAAGTHTIKVVNDGPQLHEFFLARLDSGVTAQQLVAWVHAGMKGRPPALPLGGATGLMPSDHAFVTLSFAPGDYALLCFLPDARDGREHVMHGMVKQIHVS